MRILIKNVEKLKVPSRANKDDLGYDIIATSEPKIVGSLVAGLNKNNYHNIDYIEYDTNLAIAPQKDINWRGVERKFHSIVFPRSSITKYNLILKNGLGLIDASYRNTIKLRYYYAFQPSDLRFEDGLFSVSVNFDKIYKIGDKIAQLVPYKNIDIDFELVDSLDETERNTGGFGSTGK